MRLKLVLALSLMLPMGAFADDHMPPTNIAAIYECNLMDGVTADDVAAFGAGKFKNWVVKNDYNVGSYLWEAVAVSPPFNEPDMRWVNYFQSWSDYFEISEGWERSGKLAEEFATMASCDKARFAIGMRTGGAAPQAKEKPLIASVCQLNDGKTLQDAIAFMPKATSVINATADASITTFLWSNFIGVSGLDYIAFFTGETAEMVKVMDGVKNGTFVSAFAEAELMSPATCESDLHQSHEMVRAAG